MKNKLIFSSLLAVILFGIVGFCIITNSAGNYRKYYPSRIPFIYRLHTSTSTEFIFTIEAGAQLWNDVEGSYFEFQRGANTNDSVVSNDGINLVYFDLAGANFSDPNVIAFSSTFTTTSGGYQAVGSDLIWNARDFPPGINGEPNKMDLKPVITHELGHHLGLNHAGQPPTPSSGSNGCGPANNKAVMWYAYSRGDTSKRNLTIDDKLGAAAIYPTWVLQGTVTDSATSQPIKDSYLKLNGTYGSIVGTVLSPYTNRWSKPGYPYSEILIDSTGNYATSVLNQSFSVTAYKFGYFPKTQSINFNPPSGIGNTEVLTFDAALSKKPLVSFSGNVLDANTTNGISAKIMINWVGESKILDSTTTASDGAFSFSIPGDEYYKLRIDFEPPYQRFIEIDSIYVELSGKNMNIAMTPVSVLMVTSDSSKTIQNNYITSLENSKYPFTVWDVNERGSNPSQSLLNSFTKPFVILWIAGGDASSNLMTAERDLLINHLNGGNRLILAGRNIAEYSDSTDELLAEYAGIKFIANNSSFSSKGFAGDVIGNGLSLPGVGSGKDQLEITPYVKGNVFKVFHYGTGAADTVKIGAVRSEHSLTKWKFVFFGVGLEIFSSANRDSLITRSIRYTLDPNVSTGIGDGYRLSELPLKYFISQNFPNPFNPETVIKFAVPQESFVMVKIYNMLGKEIRTLISDKKSAGYYDVNWNGRDNRGNKVASGTYIYQMIAKNEKTGKEFVESKKMVLLK